MFGRRTYVIGTEVRPPSSSIAARLFLFARLDAPPGQSPKLTVEKAKAANRCSLDPKQIFSRMPTISPAFQRIVPSRSIGQKTKTALP
jgi:hypothetical protein